MHGRRSVQPRYTWPRLGRILEIVRLLIEHGADLEAMSGDGKTALQVGDDMTNMRQSKSPCNVYCPGRQISYFFLFTPHIV